MIPHGPILSSLPTKIAFCLLTVFVVSLGATTVGERHYFILYGQSNMARMNPNDAFRPEIEKLFPEAEILLVKEATGGKPIRNWLSEWDELAIEAGLDPGAAEADRFALAGVSLFSRHVNGPRKGREFRPCLD